MIDSVWPEGVQMHGGKMLWEGKVCVPEDKVFEVIREHHDFLGHIGVHRLVHEVGRRFSFPSIREGV